MELDIIEETQFSEKDSINKNEIASGSNIENRLLFYVQRLKLAVAVAVIRSTPPEMTPEEYATYLIQNTKDDSNNWKNKCETLERELVVLTQKLETVAIKEKLNISDMDIVLPTSNRSTGFAVQPFIPPPRNLKFKISSTIEFVRSFILLCSVPDENYRRKDEYEKYKNYILKSVALLYEYLRSPEGLLLEFEIVNSCVQEMHRLFDSKANYFERELVSLSMVFVEKLLLDIFKTTEINMIEQQHRRSTLIQMLAEHKKFTVMILSRLLREITILTDIFATIFKTDTGDFTPLLKMENAYYVLQATEGTLHIMRQQNSSLNFLKISRDLLVDWRKTIEKSLLDIGTKFSMYSIYVWQVKTLLQSVLEQ